MCLFLYIDTTTHTYMHTNYKVQLNETSQIILSTIETSVVSHYCHFPLKYNYCPCWCIHVEYQFTSINIVLNYSFYKNSGILSRSQHNFSFSEGWIYFPGLLYWICFIMFILLIMLLCFSSTESFNVICAIFTNRFPTYIYSIVIVILFYKE